MKALAIEASRTIPRLSQEELITHFVGLARNRARVKLRKSGGNLILEYNLGQISEVAESKRLNAEIPTRPK